MNWKTTRGEELKAILEQLISSPRYPFNESLHGLLPSLPGLYVISNKNNKEGEYLRAGRTDEGGLQQRIYRNHLMGNQSGNLRCQLVDSGICNNLESAKTWIKANCQVQWLVVRDHALRKWAEHYALSILQPLYCD